ncbi:MAG: SpoIIE family protein phosphatase [Bacteroidales bacterium]|nr:SpoIIE family protein phosphatase [Bacteroidales bacterium]
MNTGVVNIVLIVIVVVLIAVLVVVLLAMRRRVLNASRRLEHRYRQEINFYDNELTRLNYLYNELAQQKEAEPTVAKQSANYSSDNDLAIERKKIEVQKEKLEQRNKKLWDMSLAIEKDKERIQMLKNQIEAKHLEVTDSIRYARGIQNALLPREDILKSMLSDYFLLWKPRDIVSGDFYWMKKQGDLLIIAICDCTGHGVPGAFMSMLGMAFLNDITAECDSSIKPSEILEQLRQKVIISLKQSAEGTLEPKDGMDMALCILNTKKMTLQFAGANNPMYLVSNGVLTEYKGVKNPIGYYPLVKPFETIDIPVKKGDYIYMFSDGFPDQFNAKTNKKVTYGRLKKLLEELNAETPDPEIQKQRLNDFFENWRNGFVQMDDVLIGGFRI